MAAILTGEPIKRSLYERECFIGKRIIWLEPHERIDYFDPRLYPQQREGHWIETGFRPDGKRVLTFVWNNREQQL